MTDKTSLFETPLHPYTEALLSAVPIPKYGARDRKRVILTGDVTLIRAPGSDGEPPMRLNTESLVALPDTEQFSTDLPVEIERGGSRINAVGMDYDNIKRTVKLRSRVRGTIEPTGSLGVGVR